MNLNDLFKSFFGIHKPGNHGEFDFYGNNDDDDGEDNDPDSCIPQDEEDFFHDARIPHPRDMFRHFEEMFRTFGLQDFPPPGFDVPGLEPLPRKGYESPRDKMLKDPGFIPALEKPPQYHTPSQDRTDKDFDKLSPDELRKVLVSPNATEPSKQSPNYRSFFKSVSVSTVRGPDGKIEQTKTVRDSAGNEETTITRSHGDQTYSHTTRRDPTGLEEKREDLINLDEDKVGEFEKKWSNRQNTSDPRQDLILPHMPSVDESMFRKLFGSWFSR